MGDVIKPEDLNCRLRRLRDEATREVRVVVDGELMRRESEQADRAQTIQVAVEMARRIVGRTVQEDPGVLDEIYDRCIELVRGQASARVHVHPADLVSTQIAGSVAALGFELVPDPQVGRGGCLVTAEGVTVDSRVDALLNAMADILEGY